MIEEDLIEKVKEFEREAKRALEDNATDSAVVLLSKLPSPLLIFFYSKIMGWSRVTIRKEEVRSLTGFRKFFLFSMMCTTDTSQHTLKE